MRQKLLQFFRGRIARDSTILLIANYSSLALSIVTSMMLARELGKDNLGLTIIAMTLVTAVIQFMDIRTGEGMIRFIGNAMARDNRQEAVRFFVIGLSSDVLLMLATVALVALVSPAASRLYDQPEVVRRLVWIFIVSIPFSSLEGSFSSLVNVFKRFTWLAAGSILISLVRLLILVSLAPRGVVPVMWGHVAVTVFSFTVWIVLGSYLLLARIGLPRQVFRDGGYRDAWRQFIPFAFHTSVTASLKALSTNADELILGALRPAGDVAIISIARSTVSLITMPTSPISTVIYPEMNEAWAKGDTDRARRLIRKYSLISFVVSTAVWAGLFVAVDWLVTVFYGPEFLPVGNLTRVLGIGIVAESVFRWVRPAAMAQNRPQLVTFYGTIATVLRIVLLVPMVYYFGMMGVPLAYNAVVLVTILIVVFYVMPRMGLIRLGRGKEEVQQ